LKKIKKILSEKGGESNKKSIWLEHGQMQEIIAKHQKEKMFSNFVINVDQGDGTFLSSFYYKGKRFLHVGERPV